MRTRKEKVEALSGKMSFLLEKLLELGAVKDIGHPDFLDRANYLWELAQHSDIHDAYEVFKSISNLKQDRVPVSWD